MANRQVDVDLRGAQVSAPQLSLWLGQVIIHTYPTLKIEPIVCSETSAFNIQTPEKYPEDNIYTISTTQPKFENYENLVLVDS
jgi:hypothetical protein